MKFQAGAFPGEGDEFISGEFVVFDFDLGAAFFKIDGLFGGLASGSNVVAGDDFLAVDGDGAAVIGVVMEGVFAILGHFKPAFPSEPVCVAVLIFQGCLF